MANTTGLNIATTYDDLRPYFDVSITDKDGSTKVTDAIKNSIEKIVITRELSKPHKAVITYRYSASELLQVFNEDGYGKGFVPPWVLLSPSSKADNKIKITVGYSNIPNDREPTIDGYKVSARSSSSSNSSSAVVNVGRNDNATLNDIVTGNTTDPKTGKPSKVAINYGKELEKFMKNNKTLGFDGKDPTNFKLKRNYVAFKGKSIPSGLSGDSNGIFTGSIEMTSTGAILNQFRPHEGTDTPKTKNTCLSRAWLTNLGNSTSVSMDKLVLRVLGLEYDNDSPTGYKPYAGFGRGETSGTTLGAESIVESMQTSQVYLNLDMLKERSVSITTAKRDAGELTFNMRRDNGSVTSFSGNIYGQMFDAAGMNNSGLSLTEHIERLSKKFNFSYVVIPYRIKNGSITKNAQNSIASSYYYEVPAGSDDDNGETYVLFLTGDTLLDKSLNLSSVSVVPALRYGEAVTNFNYTVTPIKMTAPTAVANNRGDNRERKFTLGTVIDGKWYVDFEIDQEMIKTWAKKLSGETAGDTQAAFEKVKSWAERDPDHFLATFTQIPLNKGVKQLKVSEKVGQMGITLSLTMRNAIPDIQTGSVIAFEDIYDYESNGQGIERSLLPPHMKTIYIVKKVVDTFNAKQDIWQQTLECVR